MTRTKADEKVLPALMNEKDAAAHIGIARSTLKYKRLRMEKDPEGNKMLVPRSVRLPGRTSVFYRPDDIEKWVNYWADRNYPSDKPAAGA